jgi:hypothetical protein
VSKHNMPYWTEVFHLLVCCAATVGSPLWPIGTGHQSYVTDIGPLQTELMHCPETLVTYRPLTMCNTPEGWAPQLRCSHSPKSHILSTRLSVTHTGEGCVPSSVSQTLRDQCSAQVMAPSTPRYLGTWTELISICCSTCILPSFMLQWWQ